MLLYGRNLVVFFPGGFVAQMVKCLSTIQETQVRSLGGKISWRRKWQFSSIFLPGEFQAQRSLAGYSPWGREESDTTQPLTLLLFQRRYPARARQGRCSSDSSPVLCNAFALNQEAIVPPLI